MWIDYNTVPIPEELKYPNWQTDKDECQQSALMYWFIYRNQPIPEDMKYHGW